MIPLTPPTSKRTPEIIISEGGKDDKEHIKNLFDIKKSVTFNDDTLLRQNVFSKLFEVDSDFDGNRPRTFNDIVPLPSTRGGQVQEFDAGITGQFSYENDYDTDLKTYLGEDKYDLFNLYQEKGDLDLDDIPDSLKDDFYNILTTKKRERVATQLDNYNDTHTTFNPVLAKETIPVKTKIEAITSIEELYESQDPFTTSFVKDIDVKSTTTNLDSVVGTMDKYMNAFSLHVEDEINEYNSLLNEYNIPTGEDFDVEKMKEFLDNETIPFSTRKKVFDKQLEVVSVLDEFKEQATKADDGAAVLESLNKSYSTTYRMALGLEEIMFEAVNYAMFAGELAENFISTGSIYKEARISSFKSYRTNQMKQANIMTAAQRTQIPFTGKMADLSFQNLGSTVTNMLADNTFSIVAAYSYQGLAKRGLQAIAKKGLTATWVVVEGAGKLNRMEKLQQSSGAAIAQLEQSIADPKITPQNKIAYQRELEKQQKYRDYSTSNKAVATLLFGGIAAAAERIGTMRWIDDMVATSKYIGVKNIKDGIRKSGKFLWMSAGTETIEESVTLLGHNIVDNVVLGEDKSLIEGMDADFFANVIVTSLAIAGPSASQNMKMIIGSALKTSTERKRYTDLLEEYTDNLDILEDGTNLGTEGLGLDRSILEQRNQEILKEIAAHDIGVFGKISELSREEVEEVFNLARKQMSILRNFTDIGSSGQDGKYIQKEKEKLQKEYDDLQAEKEKLLKTPEKNRLIKLEETHGKTNVTTKMYEDYGKHHYFNAIVRGVIKDKDKFKVIENRGDLVKVLDEAIQNGDISEEFKEQVLAGYDGTETTTGGNATFLPTGAILVFDENVRRNLDSASELDRQDAIQSAIHELGHIFDINNNLVVDGEVVKEARLLVEGLTDHIKKLFDQGRLKSKDYSEFLQRVLIYKEMNNGQVDLAELLQIIATMKRANMISTEESSLNYFIKSFVNKLHNLRFGENAKLLGLETTEDVLRYIDNFNKRVLERKNLNVLPPEDQEGVMLSAGTQRAPEKLIRIIKNKNTDKTELAQANSELLQQYNALALTAINFSEEYGDIPRKNVVSALSVYLPGLITRYVSGKGKFSTFVTANIKPKDDTIFEEAKILAIRDGVKLDDPNIKDLAGDVNDTANTQQTFVQKIDMFEDFSIVSTKSDNIKSKIKVKKGDTFKEVISNNAGQVGQIIFDIAADKIMKGGANLSLVTKYKEGMPIPAEAQSIQRVFSAGENASKFLKTLPLLNVSRKTADINKIGENIDVSREVYGRAIGLKGLVMDYFYEDYVDTKATSKDRAVKKDAETSPSGRSLGLSSQTDVKILKPEFRNPTPETIEKLKKDLGITPKNQPNVYNRDIGQFLKGAAKTLSIGVALSGAQRKLEKEGASKSDIAKVTTAQSKAAFSAGSKKMAQNVDALYIVEGGAVKLTFEGDLDRVDKILKKFIGEGTYKFNDETQIRDYFNDFEKTVIKNLPKNMFMGALSSFLKPSKRILPNDGKGEIKLEDGRTVTVNDFFDEMRAGLVARSKKDYKGEDKLVFGAEFEGEGAKYVYGKTYGSIYGKTSKEIETSFYSDIRKNNNAIFASMHQQFMARVNNSIRKDNKNAKVWGNYFSLVGQNTEHPWRMGAEYVLFSKNPIGYGKGNKFKLYEWEHAMMATRSYLYLLETSLEQIDGEYLDFDRAYKLVMENYKLIALDNYEDKTKLVGSGRQKSMGKNWQFLVNTWLDRYFHPEVAAIEGKNGFGINPKNLFGEGRQTADQIYNVNINGNIKSLDTQVKQRNMFSRGTKMARGYTKDTIPRGMSAFDFDETVGISNNFVIATKDGETKRIASDEWPFVGDDLVQQGWKMDFTDFNRVTNGKPGPLMQKMKNQIEKFGPKNVFILTARAPQSEQAIHEYLKSEGINIPLENITGLGNSTGEAKAMWMLEKFSEGYNDMYFVDDALPNVKAVKNVLEQLDIKSKVVQARVNFSAGTKFNTILEEITGIDANKRFSAIKARKRGASKGKFKLFIPPSHEDFVGLLYNFIGTGKMGNRHRDFFEKTLIRPLNRAFRELNNAKQAIANDYKALKKTDRETAKKLNNKIKETKNDYNYEDAARVYLWNKYGYSIPGLSKADQNLLVEIVNNDSELKKYAETVSIISRQDKYVKPTEEWEVGDIRTDLIKATDGVNREQFFVDFNNNAKEIFSKENMNKIEAAFGENVREALEDMIYRISKGTRRPQGVNKNVNRFLDYLQASIGGVMFFNMRSAILQQLSVVNFINFEDNNLFHAAKAFANQRQYWTDWSMIFNSDMLKQRRGGLTMDVNYQDIASYASRSKQPVRSIIKRLLALGFTPTQISDSMAIASGGAGFYRNRVNTYIKKGMSQKEAEKKAFEDFQIVAESTQQSARPDMTSSQQNSVLGWMILGFQNVTSQYARIIKKSASDLIKRRISPPYTSQKKSDMANVSRILYYGFAQNIVFYTLQTALFAAMFNDDPDDEDLLKKKGRILNGTIDSLLRGSGVGGAIIATLKNMAFAFAGERTKSYNPDESSVLVEALNYSPPLGIKARKIVNAEKTFNYDRKVMDYMDTFDIDNPVWSAATNYVEALTTLPTNRLYRKTQNLQEVANRDNSTLSRIFMLFGWSKWNLGIEDPEIQRIRTITKRRKNRKQLWRN